MIKRTIKETMREYDEEGRLTMETITETEEEDDCGYTQPMKWNPVQVPPTIPYCNTTEGGAI